MRNGPGNGQIWKVMAGVVGLLAVVFTVMGIVLRAHAAQPHDKAVSESEFQIFIQQDIEQMRAIREDLREIRNCLQGLMSDDVKATTPQ